MLDPVQVSQEDRHSTTIDHNGALAQSCLAARHVMMAGAQPVGVSTPTLQEQAMGWGPREAHALYSTWQQANVVSTVAQLLM